MTIDPAKLLPCPFCGGDAVMADPHGAFSRLAAVCCPSCEIKGETGVSAEIAASNWNTRPDLARDNIAIREALAEAVIALNAMMDAWFDYHDAHSLTQSVTGRAGNAFDLALAAREKIEAKPSDTVEERS